MRRHNSYKGRENVLKLIVREEQNLKEFTENEYAQASFAWSYLLKNKEIRVNGKRVDKDVRLFQGDEVTYYLTPKQAEKTAFFTVYEDENVIVVDKESGVNSEAVFAALAREGECYFIHRLDRNTKGLLIFARNAAVEAVLLAAFRDRKVEKRYHALCFGAFPKKSDVLTAYLKKDAARSLVYVSDTPTKGADKIVTEYAVIENASEDSTLVEVILHTGKTHQIRAHLAHIGCPIAGDMKYGDNVKNKAHNCARQCLVAKKLSFNLTGKYAYLGEKTWISRFEASFPYNS
ncbi:MAG: RluA family pseudouridine synthase [Clostridia bacterium]|nr:RluA family pseudouridine synthase [Clostridia bacterium]